LPSTSVSCRSGAAGLVSVEAVDTVLLDVGPVVAEVVVVSVVVLVQGLTVSR